MRKHFLLPGRFRPFHWGHCKLLQNLLEEGYVTVIICWSNVLNEKSPIMAFETRAMIKNCLKENTNLRICQMPYFEDGDDYSYARFLSKFVRENTDNYIVSGNPLVTASAEHYLHEISILSPYDFVTKNLKKINGKLVRQQILQNSNDYIGNVPDGTMHILQKADILQRIQIIKQRNLNLKLDDAFPIKVIDADQQITYLCRQDSTKFLDDLVIEHLTESGYMLASESQLASGELKAVGLEGRGHTYYYTFFVSGKVYRWRM